MTSLHQRLVVSAVEDGILLRPSHVDEQATTSTALQLAYGSGEVKQVIGPFDDASTVEVYGILGVIDLVSTKYLTLITKREQVATISDKPIYTITDVSYIPLISRTVATGAVEDLSKHTQREQHTSGYATDESDHVEDEGEHHARSAEPPAAVVATAAKRAVQDFRSFGSFAQKWISKGSTTASDPTSPQKLDSSASKQPADVHPAQLNEEDPSKALNAEEQDLSLTDDHDSSQSNAVRQRQTTIDTYSKRILRNARLYYSSKSFFFSYEHNLSLRWSELTQEGPQRALHTRFHVDFFWNKHILGNLIAAEQNQFILPVLQGFVGQRTFTLQEGAGPAQRSAAPTGPESTPSTPSTFVVTLISRRSVKRAGLRYLRRGVDEHGNVANYVETEQLLWSAIHLADKNAYSLIQVRGSIPLFFSQSPYSFKPLPQTFGSEATNQEALRKHFEAVSDRYGQVQVASLVDKHGTEMAIGEAYEKTTQRLSDAGSTKKIAFEWFDFHKECKGMRFENVSILIKTLQPSLESFGWTVSKGSEVSKRQTGILRTNCMDCLDRTNVTQSSVAGWVLQQQMTELGHNLDLSTDIKSIWFNQLWADNGDAISRQYAGTAALKGDFTRTRKRNWTGALSDFSLTLNRYYNNIFGDYFLQTCIDYLLGNIAASAFDDFETNMMTQDYALDIRRVRQNAIDVCIKIVVEDPTETLISGWTLSCPQKANTLRTLPFEECVLLLTDVALYFCRFDWSTEKVGSFERVDLADITALWRGAYITNALSTAESDETRNVGFALYYNTRGTAIVRTNTRSMDNEKAAADQNASKNEAQKQAEPQKEQRRLLAFKMLHSSAFVSKQADHETDEDEPESAKKVSTAIADAMVTAFRKARGVDFLSLEEAPKVDEKPVVSLADAKKSTSYVDSIGHSLKKLVW
ncbi:hypothetical protein AMS68_001938 [Peltaster fructicola]|uniref:SAC domain-containing protein n=1 Tax=Peltaster fructicola TaxID=286661 RepID=A0A6H0XP38_9PEZI|nr:hypothetical protein AMS68_001938 [Peltaster fructicola]